MRRRLAVVVVLAVGVGAVMGVSPLRAANTPTTIAISPPSFFFCCTHPTTATYTITDTGGAATGPLRVKISGNGAKNFKVSNNGCQGTSLAPQGSCFFDVTWEVGSDSNPTLSVTGLNASLSVQLYGTAVP